MAHGERTRYPASANQKRMYVLNRLSPDGTGYNVPVALRLKGSLSVARLRKALSALVGRHASLRTSFGIVRDEIVQHVKARIAVPWHRRDAYSHADVGAIRKDFVRPFDLHRAPLLRVCLISLAKADHVLLLDLHHIVCDGVSVDILLDDLGRLYAGETLKKPPREYTDFALWQQRFAGTPEAKQQEAYWLELLRGDRPTSSLPTDVPRKLTQSFAGDRVVTRMGGDFSAALRAVAAANRVSMYMLLLAAYDVLLSKYTGQDDVMVGTLVSGRRAERFRGVVGLFVNTLLLRSRPGGRLTFVEFLKQVRGDCLDAFEHQDYQFEDLVDRISPPRDLGRNPLFATMFSALSADERVTSRGAVEFSRYPLEYDISKFDLSLTSIEQPDHEVVLEFEYCTDLFRKPTMERLSASYVNVLETIVANPTITLAGINLLSPDERRQVLALAEPRRVTPAPNVLERFEAQVRADAQAPAVSWGAQTLSYGTLHARARRLASALRTHGVAPHDLVGVMAPPSIEMIVAVLGVLDAGAAYLPIDPSTPAERVRGIVADSGLTTIVVHGEARHLEPSGLTVVRLDDESIQPEYVEDDASPGPTAGPDDLAYVIYTSGSTGTPKGVMVSHGALANYVDWATRTFIGDERLSFALHSPLSVDLTVTSVFTPLVSGGRIVIYRTDDGASAIRDIVSDNQVEIVKLTPTHLMLLNETAREIGCGGSRLRRIVVGGEDLKTSLASAIDAGYGGLVEIFNEYGPTEATVGCTIRKYAPGLDTALSVPIGRPIDNTGILLLDKDGNPVPAGVTGEIYITGVCLAEGYLNNPRLTNERFAVHRFGSLRVRAYRTGDLARMLPSGDLEYQGRNDDQVKIRGFRIELGEVEASLQRLPHVKDAVVTKRIDAAGDAYLCAHVVVDGGVSGVDLRAALREQLPAYMIPAWIVPIERLPVARGGKLDRSALPDPRSSMARGQYVPPRSRVEAALATIWEQVLDVPTVGIDDDFFDLGGQSLKATLMIARANAALRANLSLRDAFTHPVIRRLSVLIPHGPQDAVPALAPVAEREYYPVSPAQKRLFILNQLAPADVQYNVPFVIRIAGPFDRSRWEQAFRSLIARHESLRTSFAVVDDEIVQRVRREVAFAIGAAAFDERGGLQPAIERFVRPFDLSQAPLMRVAAIDTDASAHALLVDLHHIVSDGMSIEIILEELGSLYRGDTLEPPAIQYKDYAAWQRAYANTPALASQKAYWTTVFEGELPVVNLPTDFSRGATQSFEGDLVRGQVDAATVERLRAIGRDCGATMHMTLLTAYTILLSKYSGQDDIIVGTPVAGRNHASLENVVGMFVNTLAMRIRPRGELTFSECLRAVRSHALDAYSNQDYQFEELVDELKIERDLSRNPLFDTVFASLGPARRRLDVGDSAIELVDFDWKIAKFDLTLLVAERERGLDLELEYCTRLFRRDTMERFAAQYRHLLDQIARHPERRIADLDPLTPAERRQVLVTFNPTAHAYPADRGVHELFEAQVDRHPGNVAVVCGDTSLSYLELNRLANRIARRLAGHGVTRGHVVGIMAGPSIEMIAGVLAILKTGAAYLPIDRDCPPDRVRGLLDDSGARVIAVAGGADWHDDARVVVDLGDPDPGDGSDANLGAAVTGRDLAYVIYTSGTTGVPKGVMIEHHAVNNLCAWHIDAFHVTAADRATKYARFSFDASVWEIFPYLQAGAALHVIDDRIRLDMPRLHQYFEEHGITISFLPTQVCELFMERDNASLRTLLTGGDRLRRFRPASYRVVNNYGPTESTVVATSGEVTAEDDRIPIGTPVFNTRVYVLGPGDAVVPIGVPGELCIAGAGLARGYINDAEKTAGAFVSNPLEPGGRMYRTGDLVRWRPDGRLEYLGRTDSQVKIRGCRTEPREIEASILAHEAVKDAVVVAREDRQHHTFLCAYIVWHEAPQHAALRDYLARQLPDYMVPAFLLTVPQIPINPRGKVDTARLPMPDASPAPGGAHVTPRTTTERRLAEIWCRVLDRDRVSVHDNFFEIGGDSLHATVMLAKANREFAADVALGAVFDHPSIAALAPSFEGVEPHESVVLPHAEPRLYYATTPTQALLYALCTSRKGVEYNLPMAFTLDGDLNVARLEEVFRQLIRRHEALRTSFRRIEGRVVQTVAHTVDFAVDRLPDCDDEREIGEIARDFIRPFDFTSAPLLRVALTRVGPRRHVLLMDMHHLVSDGTSMGIVFQEMAALYAGHEPPIPAVTFTDFAEWLPGHLTSGKVRDQEQYWKTVFADPIPVLRLDTDHPRPGTFSFAGGAIEFTAGAEMYGAVKTLCAQQGVTLYMLLLAVYSVLLSKYSGGEDVIVGVPTVGRHLADVQDVVGMFVSTHAIRTRPDARLRFDDFLQEVKTAVRGALEHQEYQLWDMMVSHSLRSGGTPLFSTVFVVQDQSFTAMEMPGLDVQERDAGYRIAKFDLTFGAVERSSEIAFEVEYSTDVFQRRTAKRFVRHYLHLLEQVVADPGQRLRHLDVVTGAERREILHAFNGTALPSDSGDTVVQRFERQAREFPHRVAVVCDGRTIDYGELNRRANQMARGLRRQGIDSGDVVAVMARPSVDMMVETLAVLKAGAAYLPLSPGDPSQRIAHMLRTSGAKRVLGDLRAEPSDPDGSDLEGVHDAGSLACVSYAADRTGTLRGATIGHRALLDRCRWYGERFAVTPDDRGAKYGDLSARASLFELFPFLCAGASVWIIPEDAGRDAARLHEWLDETGVTMAWLPAPLCERLASADHPALRVLVTSGDHVGAARRGAYELVRCAGPAESTEVATCGPVGGDAGAVIGTPIQGSELYILGHDDGVVPVGVTGQLCVAGAGLATGYIGDPDATSNRFTANPHVVGGTMYRTGQTARWLPDGRVELTGRIDEVNIDGRRVSLSEIERRLDSHPSIREAVVLFDGGDPLHQRLVAFLVTHEGAHVPAVVFVEALKAHLAAWLPACMVPDTYVKVGRIPRDTDGRVRYETLPIPERQADTFAAPPPTPANVQAMVEDLLSVARVGPDANLVDLGMDSLHAARLVARLHGTFGAAPDVCQLMATPTISAISRTLEPVTAS